MLTIHHFAGSRSERVVWLCEDLGLDYRLYHCKRPFELAAPAQYKALHPAGAAPIIEDDGIGLAESGAIMPGWIAETTLASLSLSSTIAFAVTVVARCYDAERMMEGRLAQAPYLTGVKFTAADIINLFAWMLSSFASRELPPFSRFRDCLALMQHHLAYIRAMKQASLSEQVEPCQ